MTKFKNIVVIFFTLVLSALSSADAQFVNIQLTIEPELSATVVTELNFGTIITNSGERQVELGDPNMGVFTVRGFKSQKVFVSATFPEALEHENPDISANIPIDLTLSINNSGVNEYENSFQIENLNTLVDIHDPSKSTSNSNTNVWETMYIYVFGSIFIGNIPNGTYDGNIMLTVQYD
jgi:hypothetical protein